MSAQYWKVVNPNGTIFAVYDNEFDARLVAEDMGEGFEAKESDVYEHTIHELGGWKGK